tara:strand:- start:31 stop:345 length:315 start_codon:yes stop_codon:yes gene_type:complete
MVEVANAIFKAVPHSENPLMPDITEGVFTVALYKNGVVVKTTEPLRFKGSANEITKLYQEMFTSAHVVKLKQWDAQEPLCQTIILEEKCHGPLDHTFIDEGGEA